MKQMNLEPIKATVHPEHCSGCPHLQHDVPYNAISFDDVKGVSFINAAMCQGCGTCVAACPAGAISGTGFSDEQVLAQIEGLLRVGADGLPLKRAAYPWHNMKATVIDPRPDRGGGASMSTQAPVAPAPAEGTGAATIAEATTFEPVIIGFTCNWCSYRAPTWRHGPDQVPAQCPPHQADVFGSPGSDVRAQGFLGGRRRGLVSGCHPGECHYIEQNYKALRRFQLLSRTIQALGHRAGTAPARLGQRRREGVRLAGEIARVTKRFESWVRSTGRPARS